MYEGKIETVLGDYVHVKEEDGTGELAMINKAIPRFMGAGIVAILAMLLAG